MKLEIGDEDGIIAIVNSEKYPTFVNQRWTLDQIMEHFVTQMNAQNIIVWQTNNFGGGYWEIEILDQPSPKKAQSEFKKTIEVTDGRLFVANYTDLTMAAQFENKKIPSKENITKIIDLENGMYELTVRRMFNPDEDIEDETVAFEIIAKQAPKDHKIVCKKLYWYTF